MKLFAHLEAFTVFLLALRLLAIAATQVLPGSSSLTSCFLLTDLSVKGLHSRFQADYQSCLVPLSDNSTTSKTILLLWVPDFRQHNKQNGIATGRC